MDSVYSKEVFQVSLGYHGITVGAGSVIAGIVYGSPAQKAGCRPHDKLLEINGSAVKNPNQAKGLLVGIAAGRLRSR